MSINNFRMNQFTLFENFLPEELHVKFTNLLLSDNFPWYYNPSTVNDLSTVDDGNIFDTHQFYHNAYNDQFNCGSEHFELFKKALYYLQAQIDVDIKGISRIKANLTLPFPKFSKDHYHPPHFDVPNNNCLSLVYYAMDSDGPTVFFDKNFSQGKENLKIVNKIYPKANTAVLFNSGVYHSSSNPIKYNRRIVFNYILYT